MLNRYVTRYLGLIGPWCVLLFGLIATVIGARIAVDAGIAEVRGTVALDSDRIAASIAARVQINEQMLTGAAALFAASVDVTRKEWRDYLSVQRIGERFPDVATIGFAELVEADERAAHEERMRRDGIADYEIRPTSERRRYMPTIYSEPDLAETRAEIGYDVYTDPIRRDAVDQAFATGSAALTAKMPTAGGVARGNLGDLKMYAPAVRNGVLLGAAVATLRTDTLLTIAQAPMEEDLSIRLYDGPSTTRQAVLFDGAIGVTPGPDTIAETRTFIAGGRPWTVEVIAAGRLPGAATRAMPLLVVLGGIAITLLAYLVTRVLQRARMGERRFRDYAELATDWLWEHDRDLRFTFISNTRTQRVGLSSAALGKTRRQIAGRMGDPEELATLERFEALMRAGKPFTGFEYSTLSRSGGREYFRISAKPLLAPNGEIRGYRGVTQVVTAEKRREQELRDAKSAAEAASASKSRFLAMMSHELRTPLNAIIGFSDVVAELRFGAKAIDRYAEYARIINRSGQQLLDLISQLLDMSKIEAGKLELIAEAVDPAEIVRDCISLLQDRAGAGGVIMRDVSAGPVARLWADRRALRQIVLNLLSNAVKFTAKGGAVTVSFAEDEDGAVVLRITDNGIGISPEAMARIFQPFHQADATIARRFGGTGLGLAISRALVEAHDAKLSLSSTADEGTTATVRFPPNRTLRDDALGSSPKLMLAAVAD